MALRSFGQFTREVTRLRGLSAASKYAFGATAGDLSKRMRAKQLDPLQPVTLPGGSAPVAPSSYAFLNQLQRRYPAYIRETVFVRLVSTLELLLVDCVRDLFFVRMDLFADHNRKIELTHGEVLSAEGITKIRDRIIGGELRQLHSSGIREMAKYYRQKLGIGFADLGVDLSRFWEFIDRRHLLVHRLGRADEAYRHTYNYGHRAVLTVSEAYLEGAFATFEVFKSSLEARVAALHDTAAGAPSGTLDISGHINGEIELEVITSNGELCIDRSFAFMVNDRRRGERFARLSDILRLRKKASSGHEILTLSGDAETIGAYLRQAKRLHKKGDISIISRRVSLPSGTNQATRKKTKLNRESLVSIAKMLPKAPWAKGIHKEIAVQLAISNSESSRALDAILNDDELLSLLGTGETLPQ